MEEGDHTEQSVDNNPDEKFNYKIAYYNLISLKGLKTIDKLFRAGCFFFFFVCILIAIVCVFFLEFLSAMAFIILSFIPAFIGTIMVFNHAD